MKIRTDFVTNSSSSSFVVDLNIQLLDGTAITISSHEESGDMNAKGCSFIARDSAGNVIASGDCDPVEYCMTEMEFFDPEEIPYEVMEALQLELLPVNLTKIRSASSLEDLVRAIKKPFGLYRRVETDEDACTYEDGDAAEIIGQLQESFSAMVEKCDSVLSEHLTSVSDLKNASVSMEFGGYGEFLAAPDEILGEIFTWVEQKELIPVLDEDDEDEISNKLRSLNCLTSYTDEAINTLINFWKNCECAPSTCNVTQTLLPDGKIDLAITWEEF